MASIAVSKTVHAGSNPASPVKKNLGDTISPRFFLIRSVLDQIHRLPDVLDPDQFDFLSILFL